MFVGGCNIEYESRGCIKYERWPAEIEGVLPIAAGGVQRDRGPDHRDRISDRLALDPVPRAHLARRQRLPGLEQKPPPHPTHCPCQNQHRLQGQDLLPQQHLLRRLRPDRNERGPAADALRGTAVLIEVRVGLYRKKKKNKKRNTSQMRRPRPIRKKRRR